MRQIILLGGIKGSSTRTVVVTIAKHVLRSTCTCLVGEYQDMPATYSTLRMSLAMRFAMRTRWRRTTMRVYNDIYLMLYVLLIELYNSESIFPTMAQLSKFDLSHTEPSRASARVA